MTPSDMPRTTGDGEALTSRTATIATRVAIAAIGVVILVVISDFFDAPMAVYAEALPPDAVSWGSFISDLGRSGYMFVVSAALAIGALVARATLRTRRFDAALTLLTERAVYVFAVLAASGLAAQIIKHLVGRARPSLFRSFGPYHFDLLSMKNALASFPSGHTTTAFAMAVALSLIIPRYRVALFTLALAIGLSRIVVQAHYMSDIAAGGVLGAATALIVAIAFARRGIAFTTDDHHLALKGEGLMQALRANADGAVR